MSIDYVQIHEIINQFRKMDCFSTEEVVKLDNLFKSKTVKPVLLFRRKYIKIGDFYDCLSVFFGSLDKKIPVYVFDIINHNLKKAYSINN